MSMSGVPVVRVCPTNSSTDQQVPLIADATVSPRIEMMVTCDWHSLGSFEDEYGSALHVEARFVSSHSEGSELRSRTCHMSNFSNFTDQWKISTQLSIDSGVNSSLKDMRNCASAVVILQAFRIYGGNVTSLSGTVDVASGLIILVRTLEFYIKVSTFPDMYIVFFHSTPLKL